MQTTVTITSKGQFTLPIRVRRDMGLNKAGAKAMFVYDESAKRFYFEKPVAIEDLNSMNQAILRRQHTSLTNYKSGDGFRMHVTKKFGV